MEMIITIQMESTPNLYISLINCLKNIFHLSGKEIALVISSVYSPSLCNALFIRYNTIIMMQR